VSLSTHSTYLRVAIDVPLRKSFDYRLPDDWHSSPPPPGCRLKVPFGRKQVIGILLYCHDEKPSFKLKPIDEVIDYQPLLDDHLLGLLSWASNYYRHAIGELMSAALPTYLRQGKPAKRKPIYSWHITGDANEQAKELSAAPKQLALYQFISSSPAGKNELELNKNFTKWRAPIKALLEKNLLMQTDLNKHSTQCLYHEPNFQLNTAQQNALQNLLEQSGHFSNNLLHGVTGSGKTEIYLHASWHMLQQNKQVLVLVPEIGLTPQLIASFKSRFTIPIAVLHSGLNDTERLDAWLSARNGDAKIIIGTRSAVFVPLHSPGLIIIDEEHDGSFKQMEGFRYSARDVAIKRASMLDIPILLGSATPSLESFNNLTRGKSTLLSLPDRTADACHPDIFRLDLRSQRLIAGLSPLALKAIEDEIQQGGQALLFLNRRGYAPTLVCDTCGWIAECHHCDVRMTVHRRDNRLRCHVCAHETTLPTTCPECGSTKLAKLGQGTEKLEEMLQTHFPDAGVIRVDRDSTRHKGSFKKIIQSVRSGENKILIGTQMLAKGHHFPQVGTVIIVDADSGLYGLDFRAQEHMAQLITQVAGRAGREKRHGKVYIQTWHPDHPFFDALQNLPYEQFAADLLKQRAVTGMPPMGYLALIRVESNQMLKTETFINQARKIAEDMNSGDIEILGPAIAPLERKAGYYRMQLLFKAVQRANLHKFLGPWIEAVSNIKTANTIRWSVDVDPYNLY